MICDFCKHETDYANYVEGKPMCWCIECPYCNSKDTVCYDDGEGYPPNCCCHKCENWWDGACDAEEIRENIKNGKLIVKPNGDLEFK
jgi:hypothetical protein